jgi:thiamine-monophosphate kinase
VSINLHLSWIIEKGEIKMTEQTIADLGEFGFVELLKSRLAPASQVILGLGDDAAIVQLDSARVVASTDMLVEGQHFKRDWSSARDIGHRAAAANLADIVATGATPTALLIGLAIPGTTQVDWLIELVDGICEEAALVNAAVVGGDTTKSESLTISITALGNISDAGLSQAPLKRSGAEPGNLVIMAGRLGWAEAGLSALRRGFKSPKIVCDAHRRPKVPYFAGTIAKDFVSSMIDVSDGLLQDLGHIAKASEVHIDLKTAALLPEQEILDVAAALNVDPMIWVMTGGDDHAFVATLPRSRQVPDGFKVIGEVFEGSAQVTIDGKHFLGPKGHDHFKI